MYKPEVDVPEYWIVEYSHNQETFRTVVKIEHYDWQSYDGYDEDAACTMYLMGTDCYKTINHKQLREQDFGRYKLIKKLDLYND
jgi:hypothetical protein